MQIWMAWIVGIGLILSGMADPSKVLNFLDLNGNWDPSLALVMGGAIFVGFIGFHFVLPRQKSLLGETVHLPTTIHIDRRLIIGSLAFGIGWLLPWPGACITGHWQSGGNHFCCCDAARMAIFEILERRMGSSHKQLS